MCVIIHVYYTALGSNVILNDLLIIIDVVSDLNYQIFNLIIY